ncbi:hypothetical protein ABT160_41535 [Streptomyces sp. NPDC001941]|uniref:hypothetical protein n=1 Tax=Streptomyces sp. NPDC001941 TaxID=3154659 RepID=UPI003324979B
MTGKNEDRSRTGEVTAGPGGAMTDEVGVITGDLTLTTTLDDDGLARFRVQYTGADEWYTLSGGPREASPDVLPDLHEKALDALREGGAAEAPKP